MSDQNSTSSFIATMLDAGEGNDSYMTLLLDHIGVHNKLWGARVS